jgi:hypothetical protein
MDEHSYKILVVLVFTMPMYGVIIVFILKFCFQIFYHSIQVLDLNFLIIKTSIIDNFQ